ncbi:hypothetical protein M0813_12120 [Anaeramoeba flamelloides]|uniref:BTB domain-containing protein n=1 Tax=Anaeramoeba flamelloides TaxID=1746091 RepID=A0ABQ8ZD28_9EUKA|nr:hypothetical protein M0813_12120 [Anaeramoeba flamelloides]
MNLSKIPNKIYPKPVQETEPIIGGLIFKKGFRKWLESGEFSDVTIVLNDNEYNLHKIVLSYSSEFFSKMFTVQTKEKDLKKIVLNFEDKANIFPDIIGYMYDGSINITLETAVPILAMADQFLIDDLKQIASTYVLRNLKKDHVQEILLRSIEFKTEDLTNRCIFLLAKNFWLHKDQDYSYLPYQYFYSLIHHESLAVKEEFMVFNCICLYINKKNENQKGTLSDEKIKKIMKSVRFFFLSFEQLKIVQKNIHVPQSLVVEALMTRLEFHENPKGYQQAIQKKSLKNKYSQRFLPRPVCGISFEYESDFDKNGIIFYIGTGGIKDPFSNPSKKQKCNFSVKVSSIKRGDPLGVTARKMNEFWTRDVPASWVLFDFGPKRTIIPNYYTIRHGGNYRADSLRNWDLQGSNDCQNWTVLSKHRSDNSLNGKFATFSWPINKHQNTDFRYLRLLQSGYNSSHHNFLALGGVEFYGELYELYDYL